jgi:uncharacterized membrane protein YkoI
MRYPLLIAAFVFGLSGATWAASDKELALSATISMEEVIKTAASSVPGGKPYEVEMTKKKGQVVYKVEIVDPSKNTHKVYVDAHNGKLVVEQ